MKKITFMLAGLTLLSAAAQADSQVTLHTPQNNNTVQLDHISTLGQLLMNPSVFSRSWWPGTVIAEHGATAVAQQQYQQTLADLRAWQADSEGDRAAAIGEVIRQLSGIRVTGRQFTPLDPDWVRLHPRDNRRMEGSYDLYMVNEPVNVLLLGTVSGAGKLSWQPGKSVRDYLEGHARLSGGERSIATVISPSGQAQQVPIAYWNHRHVEVEPGSIIWVGFSSWSLPGAFDDLNSRIVSALTHRVPD